MPWSRRLGLPASISGRQEPGAFDCVLGCARDVWGQGMRSAVFAALLAAGFVAPTIADDKVSDGSVPPIPDGMAVDVPRPDTEPPLTTDADIVAGVAIDAAQCKAL